MHTVAILDAACLVESNFEVAGLVGLAFAVWAGIELADRATLFFMAPLVHLSPFTGSALDGVRLTGVLLFRYASVHPRPHLPVADCACKRVFIAVVTRFVAFLGRAAIGVGRTSGCPTTSGYGFLVGSVPLQVHANVQAKGTS